MRITLPVVLLLLGASSAQGQTDTSGFAVASTVPAQSQAPTRSLPAAGAAAALPAPTLPAAPGARAAARAEEVTAAPQAQPAEPKKRSRVLWILVGAVVVLGIIVAAR